MATPAVSQIIERVRSATLVRVPWSFSYLEEALPLEMALRLSHAFDQLGLVACEREEGSKSYRFLTAAFETGTRVSDDLCMELLEFLRGEEYRKLMSEFTGRDLEHRRCTVNFWTYQGGDWLSPHVDKPDKLVTQIFYLSEHWKEGEGGRLLILGDSDPGSLVRALPPRLGSSAVIVRSDHSWHAVERVPSGAAPRKSLTVTFWNDETNLTDLASGRNAGIH